MRVRRSGAARNPEHRGTFQIASPLTAAWPPIASAIRALLDGTLPRDAAAERR